MRRAALRNCPLDYLLRMPVMSAPCATLPASWSASSGICARRASSAASGLPFCETTAFIGALPLRLKIDACCAQWLSHPDRRERLQNVMTLTELIRKSPDQEVSAVSFAEFLMRHPMRAQTEAFVEILALVIATLAKYCMHFNVCSHAQWPPFRRTLLNPLSDGTPAFESRLWQEALCLSHQIIYDQSS